MMQKANPEVQDPQRFPGSQPVSLARSNLGLLRTHRDRYHVSWKARHLLPLTAPPRPASAVPRPGSACPLPAQPAPISVLAPPPCAVSEPFLVTSSLLASLEVSNALPCQGVDPMNGALPVALRDSLAAVCWTRICLRAPPVCQPPYPP